MIPTTIINTSRSLQMDHRIVIIIIIVIVSTIRIGVSNNDE
jgi:hypothetical protein